MARKTILFVYPSSYDEQKCLIKSKKSFFPARTLPYLAALTPDKYETRILDELMEDVDFETDADLIAVTGMLRHIPRAIEIGREFRKRGKTTMIGGLGAFAIQEIIQESEAFDCIVIGEVDSEWKNILEDYDQGRLQNRYIISTHPELDNLPSARFHLLNQKKYMKSLLDRRHPVTPIETSRGCPHSCRFCLVSRYFGHKMRYRPIGDVVEEIRHQGAKHILFTDDNIAVNPERTRELFLAVKKLNIQWLGQFERRIVEDPELLRLAKECGCRSALVGIESLDLHNLNSVNKSRAGKIDFQFITKGFKEAGIALMASLIFGLENDTPETIEWTMEQMLLTGVEIVVPWMLTPLPRTPIYDDYKSNGRLLHEDYSLYDYWHPVIRPQRMSPDDLKTAYWNGLRRFYSFKEIFRRIRKENTEKVPKLLYSLYYRHQVKKGLHPFCGYS